MCLMCILIRSRDISNSSATMATARILRALCLQEKCVSESLYLGSPEMMISSQSVVSVRSFLSEEKTRKISGRSIDKPCTLANSITCELMMHFFCVRWKRCIFASR